MYQYYVLYRTERNTDTFLYTLKVRQRTQHKYIPLHINNYTLKVRQRTQHRYIPLHKSYQTQSKRTELDYCNLGQTVETSDQYEENYEDSNLARGDMGSVARAYNLRHQWRSPSRTTEQVQCQSRYYIVKVRNNYIHGYNTSLRYQQLYNASKTCNSYST